MQRELRSMCFLGANLYLETRRSNERIEEKAARTRKRGNPRVTGFHSNASVSFTAIFLAQKHLQMKWLLNI